MLVELLKIGGVAALSIGVMYLLYRELIRLRIFSIMNQYLTFSLLSLLSILVFAVVVSTLVQQGLINLKFVSVTGSDSVVIKQ